MRETKHYHTRLCISSFYEHKAPKARHMVFLATARARWSSCCDVLSVDGRWSRKQVRLHDVCKILPYFAPMHSLWARGRQGRSSYSNSMTDCCPCGLVACLSLYLELWKERQTCPNFSFFSHQYLLKMEESVVKCLRPCLLQDDWRV